MQHYSRILFGEGYRISGYNLKPLQLGHVVLLEAIDCDPVTTASQLAQAIFVCQRDWDVAKEKLFTGWIASWQVERIRKRIFRHGLGTRFKVWNEYLQRNTDLPHIQPRGEENRGESATSFIQHVRSTLLARCNYNPDTVMREPYLQAMWDYLSTWETEGSCDLVDRDWLDEMKALHNEHAEAAMEAHRNFLKRSGVE